MKKGLLFVIGVSASLAMSAQMQRVSGVSKPDLTLTSKSQIDTEQNTNFYAQASNQRNGGAPTTQMTGVQFSSSRNALTLLVSQSNCMTANQSLGAAMFTHRISADWSPAGVNSGYIQQSWTPDNGNTWDSCYTDNDGSALFRYPSGAIINPAGNTTIANAWFAISGPYTSGAWDGYYLGGGALVSGMGYTGVAYPQASLNSFPRIDIASYSDSSVWVTGELLADDDVGGSAYRGTTLNHGVWDGTSLTWTMDSIKPNFHLDGAGATDCYTMTHLTFSANGQVGYAVFFGVQASASTPETRGFQPIVYSTTDGGATWSSVWAPYDYSAIFANAPISFPAVGGALKPWFSMSNGSDMVVDNNGNLHIICTVEWGSSDDDDSLGYTWTRTDNVHYIWDIHTTAQATNTWDGNLIDSLNTSATTTQSPFSDGSAAYDLDARLQASVSPSGDHIFYLWADSDPAVAGGENAYPNMYGVGVDWSTQMKTAKKQFTFSDDAYWHYNSNRALVSGSMYTIPSSNSRDRDLSFNTLTTFDHYYLNNVTFDESEFTLAIGINEAVASFGTVAAYPNPATDVLNLNVTLNNNESVVVSMSNVLGETVSSQQHNLAAGSNNIQMNTYNLEAGVYLITVSTGTSTATTRVVVE
jgi:hypothetical protein